MGTSFNSFEFNNKLKAADVPEKQARAQTEAMRDAFAAYDAARMKELATKRDLQEIRLEIEKVRTEIKTAEIRLLKWQIGGSISLAAIMAKGFGWPGF